MQKKILWVAAALVLIATPAVIGLVALRGGDESSSSSRRAAALVQTGTGGGYQLVVSGLTPAGEAAAVLSYSWGANSNASISSTGYTTSKAQFEDLQVTKKVDVASPNFGKAVATGNHYTSATLTLYKSAESSKAGGYMIYQMTDVIITRVHQGGSADDIPTEQISLAYRKLEVTHKQMSDTGAVERQTLFAYDLSTAKTG
jgi:type VI secretion system secreted protein Hcp